MNVIIIVVDALRASDVGCYGRKENTTPNIDDLAADSFVFENAFSQSNYTDVCLSSIFSGKAPREHGVTHHGTAHTEENLKRLQQQNTKFLPEFLSDEGFETIGMDWMGRWHQWGYDEYGIKSTKNESKNISADDLLDKFKDLAMELPDPIYKYVATKYWQRTGISDSIINCEDLTDLSIKKIEKTTEPFFMFMHYWDVHPPYLPPKEYEDKFTYDGRNKHLSSYFNPDAKGPRSAEYKAYATGKHQTVADSKIAYDGALAWVDEQIGRMYDTLEKEGIADETMLIITADHGHNFGEHNIFSDNCSLYDTSIHIPLIIDDPTQPGKRIDRLVQHTDLLPTVLDFADIEIPDDIRGGSLPETEREYVFSEAIEHRMRTIRTKEWKLIVPEKTEYLQQQYWYDGNGVVELYDIQNDPDESRNVASENRDVVRILTRKLEEELNEQEQATDPSQNRSRSIDETDMKEIKSNLHALGYADDDNV
ncbi:sulfatase [Haladaptatus sp. CMAA 1911]|uniref:sulfatase family protein n=1 Tax=unclassified Haladaptatus TaxID=2622732 RepID=UPI00375408BF